MPLFRKLKILYVHIPKTGGTAFSRHLACLDENARLLDALPRTTDVVSQDSQDSQDSQTTIFQEGVYDTESLYSTDASKCMENLGIDHNLQHATLSEIKSIIEMSLRDHVIVATVRDPFDRMISDVFWVGLVRGTPRWLGARGETSSHGSFSSDASHRIKYAAILEAAKEYLSNDEGAFDNHRRPQSDYLMEGGGSIDPTVQVLRCEKLDSDAAKFVQTFVLSSSNDDNKEANIQRINVNSDASSSDYWQFRYGELYDLVATAYASDYSALSPYGYVSPSERMPRIEIVVARYMEDIDWICDVSEQAKCDVVVWVYDKSDDDTIYARQERSFVELWKSRFVVNKKSESMLDRVLKYRRLPNVGREAHTYLHHMIHHHDRYANMKDQRSGSLVFFTQGKIDDYEGYCPPPPRSHEEKACMLRLFRAATTKTSDIAQRVIWDCAREWDSVKNAVSSQAHAVSRTHARDHNLAKQHRARPDFFISRWAHQDIPPLYKETSDGGAFTLGPWFEDRVGKPWPRRDEDARWWLAAIFAVSSDAIVKDDNPVELYTKLIKDVENHNNPIAGHFLERSWFQILG